MYLNIDKHLLVIIYPTIEFSVFNKTRAGEWHLTDGAMETVFMPA